jgi:hypothetical protein
MLLAVLSYQKPLRQFAGKLGGKCGPAKADLLRLWAWNSRSQGIQAALEFKTPWNSRIQTFQI